VERQADAPAENAEGGRYERTETRSAEAEEAPASGRHAMLAGFPFASRTFPRAAWRARTSASLRWLATYRSKPSRKTGVAYSRAFFPWGVRAA